MCRHTWWHYEQTLMLKNILGTCFTINWNSRVSLSQPVLVDLLCDNGEAVLSCALDVKACLATSVTAPVGWLSLVFSSKLVKHTLCLEHVYSCLFQPLYTDKHAGDFLWTNPRVVWEYLYSDQWEPSNITRLICVDQSQVLELTQRADKDPAIWPLGTCGKRSLQQVPRSQIEGCLSGSLCQF